MATTEQYDAQVNDIRMNADGIVVSCESGQEYAYPVAPDYDGKSILTPVTAQDGFPPGAENLLRHEFSESGYRLVDN